MTATDIRTMQRLYRTVWLIFFPINKLDDFVENMTKTRRILFGLAIVIVIVNTAHRDDKLRMLAMLYALYAALIVIILWHMAWLKCIRKSLIRFAR